MTETLSLFDLIAAVDAMTFRGQSGRRSTEGTLGATGDSGVHEHGYADDEPPTAIVMPYEYSESFSLSKECDSFTVYELEGFGVGKSGFFDFITEDNIRLTRILELYSHRPQIDGADSAQAQNAAPAQTTDAAVQSQYGLQSESRDNPVDEDNFGELLEFQMSDEDDGIPLTFVDEEHGGEPELFFEDTPDSLSEYDRVVSIDGAVPAVNAASLKKEQMPLVNSRVDSVEIADVEPGAFDTPQERLEHFHPTMHAPVTHYPLRDEELEDIEADIEAEPSLIIEERLDDIYEKLSEYRRTGIDITDSVILLNSDSDIERLLNSQTPLETGDLRKLLNHFDALIGKLPDKDREAFARSEYFSLYLHIMNQLETQNG